MKLEELTALYSPLDIEYSQVMSGPYEDLSYHGDDCKVIAGLKDGRISGFWRPMVAVGDDKSLKLHIERLYDICPNIYYMDFLIDGQLSVVSQFLLRHGHKARTYYTQIIDLTKSEAELHAELRRSYRSLINKRMKHIKFSLDEIGEYCCLHRIVKGQKQDNARWNILSKMLNNSEAFIVGDKETGILYAGAIFVFSKQGATSYYFSAASHNNHNSHALIWQSIRQLKEKGYKILEMGEQVFSGDHKLVNISKFKRGFGGRTVTRLILEKQ